MEHSLVTLTPAFPTRFISGCCVFLFVFTSLLPQNDYFPWNWLFHLPSKCLPCDRCRVSPSFFSAYVPDLSLFSSIRNQSRFLNSKLTPLAIPPLLFLGFLFRAHRLRACAGRSLISNLSNFDCLLINLHNWLISVDIAFRYNPFLFGFLFFAFYSGFHFPSFPLRQLITVNLLVLPLKQQQIG